MTREVNKSQRTYPKPPEDDGGKRSREQFTYDYLLRRIQGLEKLLKQAQNAQRFQLQQIEVLKKRVAALEKGKVRGVSTLDFMDMEGEEFDE